MARLAGVPLFCLAAERATGTNAHALCIGTVDGIFVSSVHREARHWVYTFGLQAVQHQP